jgi:transporter family protein
MSNILLIIITIICWGTGSLFYKLANNLIHPIMVAVFVTLLYMGLLPIGIYLFKVPLSINQNGIMYSLLGGLGMCIGTLTYFFALREGSAGNVTMLIMGYPVITLLLSCVFLKEELSFNKIIGCVFAVCSVIFLSWR